MDIITIGSKEKQFDKTFIIDGKSCDKSDTLFKEFSKKLKFPDYFGKNWDAFNDCIGDLSWLGEGKLLIEIINCDDVLIHEENRINTFFEILFETIYYNKTNPDKKKEFWEPLISFNFYLSSKVNLLDDYFERFPEVNVSKTQDEN